MSQSKEKNSAVALFVDMVDSTGLYEAVGNTEARTMVKHYLQEISYLCEKHQGQVIKTLGDGLLAYFLNMDDALQASVDINQANISLNQKMMLSHIGIDYGEIIFRDNDIYGDAVNVASRMLDIAKSGQTIISEQAYANTGEFFTTQFRHIDNIVVKGKKEAMGIYELLNASDDQTLFFSTDVIDQMASESSLLLSQNKQHIIINHKNPSIIIGRTNECEISINSPMVSRYHAKINYHKGKFIFHDQSTNGSYVKDSKQELFLRREQCLLSDQGPISLGMITSENNTEALIYFKIES
jgi:class 3 adenylate cyclase